MKTNFQIVYLTLSLLVITFPHAAYSQNSFPTPTGACVLDATGTATGNGGELRLSELDANGTNYVGFKAPDNITSNIHWNMPSSDGSIGKVFTIVVVGNLSMVKRYMSELGI